MAITSALVVFAVIWFLTFLVVIPFRLETQGDCGQIEPGTHTGAPENHNLGKKAWITTGITTVLWAVVVAIILSGIITLKHLEYLTDWIV